jgi:uncharacterized protein YeaO (DUF488 family)
VDFDTYGRSYQAFLEERIALDDAMKRWLTQAPDLGDFTLLCFERDGKPCHRHILARWLAEKSPDLKRGGLH